MSYKHRHTPTQLINLVFICQFSAYHLQKREQIHMFNVVNFAIRRLFLIYMFSLVYNSALITKFETGRSHSQECRYWLRNHKM